MGAPTSAFLSEIYLQYIECNKIFILQENKVVGNYRYVDGIDNI
jgi:hypothetical protein